jgi:hypothetical protein
MSKKLDAIKNAVFYAKENPEQLATILEGVVSDVLTSLSISGEDSIKIPTGDTPNTADYTAKAFSQYGDVMEATITLALKESVTGVSLSNGTVSVASTATDDSFVIIATSGTVTAEKSVALIAAN